MSLGLDGRCWGGDCDNEPADQSGLCEACINEALDLIDRMAVSFK